VAKWKSVEALPISKTKTKKSVILINEQKNIPLRRTGYKGIVLLASLHDHILLKLRFGKMKYSDKSYKTTQLCLNFFFSPRGESNFSPQEMVQL
jgi:hypothetical protein